MASFTLTGDWRGSFWRKAMWTGGAALLALPAVAMQFTREVDWTHSDFVIMGLVIAAACGAVDVGMRMSSQLAYRAGVAVAVGGAFLLVWINLAVGILGHEGNPANTMYFGVLVTGLVGALLSRFRARGMMRTMLAMSTMQLLVPLVALAQDADAAGALPNVIGVTLFFLAPWLLSAALFRLAARARSLANSRAA